ncbi:MAG: hypothetical protein EVB11_00285 [Winogradskyella sp.]|nr:MAG: hypothetical protein EVB11_00285 [Winogradskyella sp.]
MRIRLLTFTIVLLILSFCSIVNAQKGNLAEKIGIESNILTSDGIYFENYLGLVKRNTFNYGEEIDFVYDRIDGFNLDDGLVYPDMDIIVLSKKGDTVFQQKNLFKDITQGYTIEDLNLRGSVTFAEPMFPNSSYKLHVKVSDKLGDGFYNFSMDFEVVENRMLDTKTNGLSYDILYLYSKKRDISLIDNRVSPNEKVYILLEGLSGYKVTNGLADLSVSLFLKDARGRTIKEMIDMLPEAVDVKSLKDQLYAEILVTEGTISNPVKCSLIIKDRNTGNSFETSFELIVI